MMKFIILGVIVCLFLGGCGGNKRPEVRNLRREVQIGRLDRDLFRTDGKFADPDSLAIRYGHYFDTYVTGVLQLGHRTDSGFKHLLTLFVRDSVIREVADTVAARYPDLHTLEKEFSSAWAYYTYYFPGRTVPEVYTHISGFNQSVVVDSAVIGISLDNYLGEKCIFYSMLAVPIPMYARKKMTRDDIVRDALTGWLSTEFPFHPQHNDLVSGMIYQGKLIYLLKHIFPDRPGNWLLGFTPEQWEWCGNNEREIWSFLVEQEYLFSTRQRLIMKYLNDAPFTSGMPAESPGRTVVWCGYRIVEEYMLKTATQLEQLMQEQDYRKILRVAGYRP